MILTRKVKKSLTMLTVVLAIIGAWALGARSNVMQAVLVDYKTEAVDKGDIRQTVVTSGQLKPVNVVSIGSQVSGEVKKLYVDFNDKVTKGQLLAEIDTSLLKAQIAQSQAQVDNTISATKLAELNAERNRRLYKAGYIPLNQSETSTQDARTARTNMEIAKAQLDRDKVNLSYAELHSPVDGVVISREVSVGQTLQASFQAPDIFKIAADLTKMQINIELVESDIGQVKEGQTAEFNVEAFPGETFKGKVSKVHISPTNPQGAVTYGMLVDVNNTEGRLLPGMTASVKVIINEKSDVLRVPTPALRFTPSDSPPSDATDGGPKHVYVLHGAKPEPLEVQTGVVDIDYTEVTSDTLKEADQVIVEEIPRLTHQ